MNIIFLTTEAVPLAKTGGLADVCGALPAQVAALGHQTAVIMPAFRSIRQSGLEIETTDISFAISMSPERLVGCRLLTTRLPDGNVPVWLIDQPQYFDRPSLYGDAAGDYPDNGERFVFFCRAAMMTIERMGWAVDIVHCNDWQAGLVPALMKVQADHWSWIRPPSHDQSLGNTDSDSRVAASFTGSQTTVSLQSPSHDLGTRSVMTIHNLAYQGHFPKELFPMIGVDWHHFNQDEFEFYDGLNFLKTGIMTADAVTTVSPRYSQEIRTPQQGCGLDAVLNGVSDRVTGIINGIDGNIWHPAKDPHLSLNYDVNTWQQGKAANKAQLQNQFGLTPSPDLPMIGLVGRLATQKGWDLIVPVLRQHLELNRVTQWIVLGSGESQIEDELRTLEERYPARFGLHIGFSDSLAHQIEAASDLFVMPSHYEPCGLNQLYSLRYGTVPVVTPTGGLADTVVNCTEETVALGTATGFHISSSTPESLDQTLDRAIDIRQRRPQVWRQMVETGMRQDWSWARSARRYVEVYEQTKTLGAN